MNIWDMLWDFLNKSASLLTILTVLFSGFAALKLYQQSKRAREIAQKAPPVKNFKERIKYHEGIQTSHPAALALSLISTSVSIKADVQRFLDSMGWKMKIEELTMQGINGPDDLETFVNELRKKRFELEAEQVTEIHLFIAGPLVAATIVGAVLDNWIPVKLYHKPSPPPPSVYEYWMPLLKNW